MSGIEFRTIENKMTFPITIEIDRNPRRKNLYKEIFVEGSLIGGIIGFGLSDFHIRIIDDSIINTSYDLACQFLGIFPRVIIGASLGVITWYSINHYNK